MQASAHSGFLQLRGTATVSRDKVRITELWNPMIETWFTEGVDDPRITVIKVEPSEGYFWDNKHGNSVAGHQDADRCRDRPHDGRFDRGIA